MSSFKLSPIEKAAIKGNKALRDSGKVHKFSSDKAREAALKRWGKKDAK